MYSSRQRSELHQRFWTAFGKYMSPLVSAGGARISWVNYQTGIKSVHFRMLVTGHEAYIGMEIEHKDPVVRVECFMRFHALREAIYFFLREDWHWKEEAINAAGKTVSRIFKTLEPANIYKEEDWPAIISFLKPRLMALDAFWYENREFFDSFR